MNASTFTKPGTVHDSRRTSVSINVDPTTGKPVQEMRTTRLEMRWAGDTLAVRFSGAQVDMQSSRAMRPRRLL